ncbi:flagellar biosynthesis protein FlhF [Pseudodesulfovibrio sp. zrk46]|uniref:flagellar biosynthesis protein FlhF n=1 Tax=Pseudodesulfovibrio sp. zrk46 TaxID=2725288 RepID=UPI001448AFC5|nr:flagellar biosynthesis protein FlhF [Pseudodesulfovibrio sp. zrk46]QJB57948.1 flagellar biosynthesis protein FlhF [Pseudodesulfovibrio sp. zrk46]
MRMKTFRAANSTAAFAQVKADLGEDAVILSNKTVTENGVKCCEIVAAVEPAPPIRKAEPKRMTRDDMVEDAMKASVGWQREWSQIKGQILQLMKPQMDLDKLSPKQKLAMEYLEREDVNEKVLAKLFCELRDNERLSIVPALECLVDASPISAKNSTVKFHAFTGPGGAGKTSSLVRIALREKKANPNARICLATADGGRGKGRIVLKHYAELTGLAFREIITRDDFHLLKQEADHFDMIFVDLPGLPGQTSLEEWLPLYGLAGCNDLAIHLVLNPYYSEAQFERFLDKYKSEQLASVIWTKLDEACTFGAILNMAFACGLPVSALSYGSGLKNSIAPASREMIWRLLFMRKLPSGDIQP